MNHVDDMLDATEALTDEWQRMFSQVRDAPRVAFLRTLTRLDLRCALL